MSDANVRSLSAFAIAAVAAATAIGGLVQLDTHYRDELARARQPEDQVMVMIAARDLYPGVPIEPTDLLALALPTPLVPDGTYLSPDHVVGQMPRERILANEPVRAARLANPDTGEGLHALLPRHMRAIALEIANGPALAGHLEPGNIVDVVLTTTDEDGRTHTRIVLQALYALAVNDLSVVKQARGDRRSTVTLMISPEDAKVLAHADSIGALHLALRNDLDLLQVAVGSGVALDALLGIDRLIESRRTVRTRTKPPPETDEGVRVIHKTLVIEGDEREVLDFVDEGETDPPPEGGDR